MLIINGGRESVPNSERRVLEALADPALPGVVVSGVYLADRRGRGRETDAVIVTPDAVAVLEVKGLTIDATGGQVELHTSANSRWWAQGHGDRDPVHVAPGDTSPFDQATGRVFDLKSALNTAPGERAYVSGAVVVVPPARARVRVVHSGPLPHGLAVLAVDRDGAGELRPWVAALRSGRGRGAVFSAERAAAALAAIGVRPPSVAELVAAGFTSDPAAAPAAVPGPPAPVGARPDPSTPPAGTPWRRPPRPRSSGARRRPTRPGRASTAGLGRALALGRAVVVAGLALAVLASVAAILLGPTPDETGSGAPDPALFPTFTSTEPTTPTPYTPPAPPRACYPFQPC